MAKGGSWKLEGLDQLERFFAAATPVVLDAATAAVVVEANETMTEAKLETPVLTGVLRGSGTVFPAQRSRDGVTVELGFGGPAASYVVPVHEVLTAHHPVGNAKFLEIPVLRHAKSFGSNVARHVGRALAGLRR